MAVQGKVESVREVMALVDELGFLPLFRSSIEGFSLEEYTPKERWFQEGVEGPWEWREMLAASDEYAYGKFFERKAGFISRRYLKDFINYRRDGYDFDTLYEESRAPDKARRIVEVLDRLGPTLSGEVKRGAGFGKNGLKGFDGAMAFLQAKMYVAVLCFDYKRDAEGRVYGFGTGRYALMEQKFGSALVNEAYEMRPEDSGRRIEDRIRALFPNASDRAVEKILG